MHQIEVDRSHPQRRDGPLGGLPNAVLARNVVVVAEDLGDDRQLVAADRAVGDGGLQPSADLGFVAVNLRRKKRSHHPVSPQRTARASQLAARTSAQSMRRQPCEIAETTASATTPASERRVPRPTAGMVWPDTSSTVAILGCPTKRRG